MPAISNKKKFIDHLKGNVIEGKLDAFSDQGTEGTHWAIYDNCEDKGDGYHRLHMINQGDYLVVMKKSGSVFWEGTVKWSQDRNNYQTYLPRYGTVHGLQEGMHPEKWAKMFFDSMPAYVIKNIMSDLVGKYAVIVGGAVPRSQQNRLVKIVSVTPGYYVVEFVNAKPHQLQRAKAYNSELRILKDDKEVFVVLLKEPRL